jgi:hypothetical protein
LASRWLHGVSPEVNAGLDGRLIRDRMFKFGDPPRAAFFLVIPIKLKYYFTFNQLHALGRTNPTLKGT